MFSVSKVVKFWFSPAEVGSSTMEPPLGAAGST